MHRRYCNGLLGRYIRGLNEQSHMEIWIALGFGMLGMMVIAVMAYQLVKQLVDEESKRRGFSQHVEMRKSLIPLKLQAYERAVLFLDRISPGDLVLRVHKSHMDSAKLHSQLVSTIKEEFGHNVSQQIYMSEHAWAAVKQAKEETIRLMNVARDKTGQGASGTELSRHIFELSAQMPHTPSQAAILILRKEFQGLFP